MLMNPLFEGTKQIQYNKTTSILVAVHTWRVVGLVFLWGVSQGILPPAFGIPAGVGDVMIGVTAIPFAYFLRRGQIRSHNLECPRHSRFSQCRKSGIDNCPRISRLYDDNIPMDSSTYCGRPTCFTTTWNHPLPPPIHWNSFTDMSQKHLTHFFSWCPALLSVKCDNSITNSLILKWAVICGRICTNYVFLFGL
jgi:hypothetical protein